MTVKHTPGPWIVKKNMDGIYAGTMSLVATESSGEIVGPRQLRHQAEGCVEANARLIAAAPDLLDALEGIIGYFDSGNSVSVSQATIKASSDEIKAARAAIAKATYTEP